MSKKTAGKEKNTPRIAHARWTVGVLQAPGLSSAGSIGAPFQDVGLGTRAVEMEDLITRPDRLFDFDALAIGGGFAHGDYLSAGLLLAHEIRASWGATLDTFVAQGRLVFGVCNGFQILTRLGLIPGITLVPNQTTRWASGDVYIRREEGTVAAMAQGIPTYQSIPVAHQEGRAIVRDLATYTRLVAQGQIVLRYVDHTGEVATTRPHNPNGSAFGIAGACNQAGTVLGMMPHPEMEIGWKEAPPSLASALGTNAYSFFAAARLYLDTHAAEWR